MGCVRRQRNTLTYSFRRSWPSGWSARTPTSTGTCGANSGLTWGKAVHRFLSGQPKTYQIYTRKLQSTIGHTGPYKHFMADLREALGQLQDAQWIHEFQISGNGRKQPHKLILQRATPNPC